MMVQSTSTLEPQSIRFLLALAAVHGFNIWTLDVRQAYLKPVEPLEREILISKPAPKFDLNPSQRLQPLRPLYGLCESGDMWYEMLYKHYINALVMSSLRSDPSLYVLMSKDLLNALSGGYVDDLSRAGDSEFRKISQRINECFDMAENKEPSSTFTGFYLR